MNIYYNINFQQNQQYTGHSLVDNHQPTINQFYQLA